jgi:hypothetical protein
MIHLSLYFTFVTWMANPVFRGRLEALGFQPDTVQSWRLQAGRTFCGSTPRNLAACANWPTIVEGERWRTATRGVQRIAPTTRFVPDTGRSGGGDWMNMEFAYESADGFRLPRAEVLRLVRSGQRSVQGNGKRYVLDLAAVDDLEESLRDVPLELTAEGARMHGAHAAYFGGEVSGAGGQKTVSDPEIRAQIGELAGQLRPYQMEGVCWMTSRILQGRGGILADEMGLGKTVQSIALALYLKRQGGNSGPGAGCVPEIAAGELAGGV